jgi:hypothetical protein
MKNFQYFTLGIAAVAVAIVLFAFNKPANPPAQYEFTSFTVIESVVPNGLGRSRIINALETRDYKAFTSIRTEEDNERNKSDREEIRVKNFEETKILNFYNIGGIRFQNIAANDAVINSKVNDMLALGWEIVSINSAVESVGGKDDAEGIFITRFYFKKPKQE